MIIKDRVSRKPNRRLISPENGTPFYAKVEFADEPIEEGTPVNKEILDPIATGWVRLDDSFLYKDSKSITTSIDFTNDLSPGMKLKLTNSVVKYCTISSVTSTAIVINESNLTSGTITDVYYSTAQNPYGSQVGDSIFLQERIGNWTYRKYNSGIAEAWGTVTLSTVNLSNKSEYAYYSNTITEPVPSSVFISIDDYKISLLNVSSTINAVGFSVDPAQIKYWLECGYAASTSANTKSCYHLWGRWK